MRLALPGAPLLLVLAACATTNYELRFRGEPMLNPNSADQPNTVRVRVLQLKPGGAAAFETLSFAELWSMARDKLGDGLVDQPIELVIAPDSRPDAKGTNVVPLRNVAEGVTHFGILARFNDPLDGARNKLLLPRAEAADVEVRLRGKLLEAGPPGEDAAPAPAGSAGPETGTANPARGS